MRLLFSFLALVSLSFASFGQSTKHYYFDTSVKVYAYGAEQTLAWCGGFNTPQFTMGDLNNDGLEDLVVYEYFKGVKTFINKGTPGHPDFRYDPQYEVNFPPVYQYLKLADYNCDHIPDLFHGGTTGFSVYKGYYNSSHQLCFDYYQDLFYTNDIHAGGAANAFNNPMDIPAIEDVDGDGDLDFISYNVIGGNMNYYKNMRVEMGLPCDSIHIDLKDNCWGKVYQGFYRTHMLNYTCDNSSLLRGTDSSHRVTHSGNTPCLFDWDMDGDFDYLDGSVSFNEMTFLKNGRMEYGGHDSMISQDTMWQTGGKQIEIATWPAAFSVDVDQDGKKDLLIAPNSGSGSENYKCVWYYKNLSTPGVPNWQFQSDTFLIDKTIDLGTAAMPMLFDFNKDGKPDLFIGSDGYRQSTGILRSQISYYLNTSTPGNPSFTLQTKNFLNIDTGNFQGAAPAVGDINNDGKSDLLLGHTNGTISYYKNTAASDSVQPVWQMAQEQLTDMTGAVINVSGNAAPFIYDIDRDGKPDLVIGSINGYLQYYRNVSTTPGTVKLQLVNTQLGQAKSDPNQVFGCYSTPFIGRIDSSGRDYLLMGSNSGNLYRFDSISSGDTSLIYPMLDSSYSYIDTMYSSYNNPGTSFGVYGNLRSSVAVADIDGDGDYEMIVGNTRGGVEFYKRKIVIDTKVYPVYETGKVQVFPNPASTELNIVWSGILQPNVQVSVINIQGQVLYNTSFATSQTHVSIPVNSLTPGMYICVIQSGVSRYYSKFTVLR